MGETLFMAALDVEKAFDRVHTDDIFKSLLDSGTCNSIVRTLMYFYKDLQARVILSDGAESRYFAVQRGVRQGDLLFMLLFNLVFNEARQI